LSEEEAAMGEAYPEIDVEGIKTLMGAKVMVQWEEAPKEFGNTGILRPGVKEKQYYTGTVIKKGLDVSIDVEEGERVFFDQFSGFGKWTDLKMGRIAIVDEEACLAVIPARGEAKVEDGGAYE